MIWIAAAAGAVWLALTMTRSRRLMLIGSAILAAGWLAQVEFRGAPVTRASVLAAAPKASCASIAEGMTAAEVQSRLGEPDEVRPDEETRGPGAKMLIYPASRCTVHLFDDRVEFVD